MSETMDTRLWDIITKTQEAIEWRTDELWFAAKTALFLWEIGAITEKEYRDIRRFIREV